MTRPRPLPLMSIALCLSVLNVPAIAAAGGQFADTQLGKEIRRGDDAADDCGRLTAKPPEFETCITTAGKGRSQGANANAFDTGLYFAAWFFLLDAVVPSLNPTAAAAPQKPAVDPKPLAAKYFKLWRDGQKQAGVSDEHMCEATLVNPTIYKQQVAVAEHRG